MSSPHGPVVWACDGRPGPATPRGWPRRPCVSVGSGLGRGSRFDLLASIPDRSNMAWPPGPGVSAVPAPCAHPFQPQTTPDWAGGPAAGRVAQASSSHGALPTTLVATRTVRVATGGTGSNDHPGRRPSDFATFTRHPRFRSQLPRRGEVELAATERGARTANLSGGYNCFCKCAAHIAQFGL